jgi:hypothetical protein
MSAGIDDTWVRGFFAAIDTMDVPAFGRAFTPDGRFRFANGDVVVGPKQIEQSLAGFYGTIAGLQHEILGIWSGRWAEGDVKSVECGVTYTRNDGSICGPIPVTTTIRMRGALIHDYRIFMDISPLFTKG